MPTYVYECAKCGEEFETWQSFADTPLKRHTGGCGGKLAKVIQPAGIVFKGSGFYKADNRGKAKGDGGESSGSGESKKTDDKKNDGAKSEGSGSNSSGSGSSGSRDSGSKNGVKAGSSSPS